MIATVTVAFMFGGEQQFVDTAGFGNHWLSASFYVRHPVHCPGHVLVSNHKLPKYVRINFYLNLHIGDILHGYGGRPG